MRTASGSVIMYEKKKKWFTPVEWCVSIFLASFYLPPHLANLGRVSQVSAFSVSRFPSSAENAGVRLSIYDIQALIDTAGLKKIMYPF